jgi:mRNA-degrading endonuclease RelE of RelBE toxin-antitoxin system
VISSRKTIPLPLNDLVKNSSSKQKSWGFSHRAGRMVPEKKDSLVRETIVGSYRLIYRVDDANKIVAIARIWHSARGIPEL